MPPTSSPLASATHKVPTVLIDERIAPCENSPFKKNQLSKKSTREGGKKVHVAVIEVSAAGSDPADDGHLQCLSLDIKEGIFGGRRKKIEKQFLPFSSPRCVHSHGWAPSGSLRLLFITFHWTEEKADVVFILTCRPCSASPQREE